MAGFIGLHRQIREHWIYQDAEYLKVWIEMLFCARFSKDPDTQMRDGQLVTINYGQFIFGRISWSDNLKISERRLRTLMDRMMRDDMIRVVTKHRKFTIYDIVNYEKYHIISPESRLNLAQISPKSDQQADQQETLEPQGFEGHSDQHNDRQTTSKRPADDQQATTKEQREQSNNVNNDNKKINYTEFVKLTAAEYEKLVAEYGEEMTKECIDILNTYKGSTGKKYKSDYMTLTPKAWVAKRYQEEQAKKIKPFPTGGQRHAKYGTGHDGRSDAELNTAFTL